MIVHFHANVIDTKTLIEIHLRTLAATSNHSMRAKYRSAIYFFNMEGEKIFAAILEEIQAKFSQKIITQILPFVAFKRNTENFLDYYKTNSEKAFCKRHIDPKIEFLRNHFAANMNTELIR